MLAGASITAGAVPENLFSCSTSRDAENDILVDFKEVQITLPSSWAGKCQVSTATDSASFFHIQSRKLWTASLGYENGGFGPGDPVTREQMAAILYRYAQYKGYDVTASGDLSGYTDAGAIRPYAEAAMAWANGAGLITGVSDTTLQPRGNSTRAQVATILMRFCQKVAE